MPVDFTRLKKSTIAIVSFFLFNITATQVGFARDYFIAHVLPLMAAHPKLAGIIPSLFGIALALHRPMVQKFLHDVLNRTPDVPAEPGATVGNTEVVTKP